MNKSEQQIQKFEEQTGHKLIIKDKKPFYGGYLDLNGTGITSLPDNLTVCGWLDLRGTGISSLPDNLTVGGALYLEGCTGITSLPDNLTVGGSLDLRGAGIKDTSKVKNRLSQDARQRIENITNQVFRWEFGNRIYIKVDGIFSQLISQRGNVSVIRQIGKDRKEYLVTDGLGRWTHGDTIADARKDLIYKISNRDKSVYENLTLDSELTFEECIECYRVITGACAAGTRDYVENRLPKPHKEKYTIREIIDITNGEYGSNALKEFFTK